MPKPGLRRRNSRTLLERLDRAAGELNPILTVIMFGLVILNLIAVTALVPQMHLTRDSITCVPGAIPVPGAPSIIDPNAGLH